ncbi:MAG: hypothetical protein NWS22_14950 [Porticoccaceae bacterium]|nr:hypothetical protein [Porticoccaceae bacterium]MDP4942780.1 hypothetical protein [OM182 bacterium]
MKQSIGLRALAATSFAFCAFVLSACSSDEDRASLVAENLATAEGMIDAFYSFDASKLAPFLLQAGESEQSILGYQGWAEGGNYLVVSRAPCVAESKAVISCAITVQDDPVLALETDFNVTDTFHIAFSDTTITNVDTSSNDQPIYYEAREWVEENMPEIFEGPCKRTEGIRDSPGDCARAMTEGYRQFMKAQKVVSDSPFIPVDYNPARRIETETFVLIPLGPDLVNQDYAAYMSSIEHLQRTFTRSSTWPHEDITIEDAMKDVLNEQERFTKRESFAYSVLTKDGERELGSVYIRPPNKPGFEAEVSLWVTQEEFDSGFDALLYEWTQLWIADSWPFKTVAYPGRKIEWAEWDKM